MIATLTMSVLNMFIPSMEKARTIEMKPHENAPSCKIFDGEWIGLCDFEYEDRTFTIEQKIAILSFSIKYQRSTLLRLLILSIAVAAKLTVIIRSRDGGLTEAFM